MHDDESRLFQYEVVTQVTLFREFTGSTLTTHVIVELRNLEYMVLNRFPGWEVLNYESTPF